MEERRSRIARVERWRKQCYDPLLVLTLLTVILAFLPFVPRAISYTIGWILFGFWCAQLVSLVTLRVLQHFSREK